MRVDLRVLGHSKETPCGWQDMKFQLLTRFSKVYVWPTNNLNLHSWMNVYSCMATPFKKLLNLHKVADGGMSPSDNVF